MVGLVAVLGCGSPRQPELGGRGQPPAQDAGQETRASAPDASPPSSPDARTNDPVGAAADAGRPDAASSGAGRDTGRGDTGSPDSGSLDAGTVVSPLASTIVAENVGTIDALAIDVSTLYWLTNENAVWVLEAGSPVPRLLAQDATPVGSDDCGLDSRLALNTRDAFWLARSTGTTNDSLRVLHRTERDGSGDTLIATGVPSAPYPRVSADETRVYWNERAESSDGNPGDLVRTLPVEAALGMAPTTLVPVNGGYTITTIALAGPTIYWVFIFDYTTAFEPRLYGELVTDLLAPQPPPPTNFGASGWVSPHDGDLYVGEPDLALRSPDGSTVELAPIKFAESIVFVDDWALVSSPSGGCENVQYQLLAASTVAAGGPVVPLANHLRVSAVLGTELAFVDVGGQVHTSTLDQVREALAASGQQP